LSTLTTPVVTLEGSLAPSTSTTTTE